jgi:SAM-dependent methyltransferase
MTAPVSVPLDDHTARGGDADGTGRADPSEVFGRSTAFYDLLHELQGKDYETEAASIESLVRVHKRSDGATLLDVACGTGVHLHYLRKAFHVEGLDSSADMLALARKRVPGVALHLGDMTNFDVGRRFDVVTCMFSSIAYVRTPEKLQATVCNFARHLRPGGVLIVEPWYPPERYTPDTVHFKHVDRSETKLARVNVTRIEGDLSVVYFHYLVADRDRVEYFWERHALGLFSHEDYVEAFRRGNLTLTRVDAGSADRGLYVGTRELE